MELIRKDTSYADDDQSDHTPFPNELTPTIYGSSDSGLTYSKGRIRSIHICNFKSYRGLVKVGPFTKFCAIVGHNGSGKSNLLDAIAFVLCIKSPNFKGSLSDVISKSDTELPYAYVEIHLNDSPEATFKRHVTMKNVITYFINDKPVTLKEYHEGLFKYKIDMVGNSSLIFQGAIANIAQRNPVDMSKLFDSVSGSHLLESQYKELKNNIDKLESAYHDMCIKKNHLEKHARRYKKLSNNETEFKKLMSKQDVLIAEKYQWEIKQLDENIQKVQSSIDDKKSEIDELMFIMKTRRSEIDILEDKRLEREREFSEAQERKLEAKRQKISMKLKNERLKAEKLALETEKNEAISRTNDIKISIETANSTLKSLKDEESALKTKLDSLENDTTDDFGKISDKIDWDLYRSIETRLSTELGEEKMILRTLERKLETDRRELKSALNSLQIERNRLKEFTDKSGKLDNLFSNLKLRATKNECEVTTCQKTLQITENKIEDLKTKIKEKERELADAKNISNLSDLYREELFINNERQQLVRRMMASVPGVCGLLSTLFQIESEKTIVLKALSTRLNLIIVSDYDTSLRCIDWLKPSKRSYYGFLELLSLDKIPVNPHHRHKKLRYLIDCISYEDRYTSLFDHLLGNYIIVQDIQTAYTLDKQYNNMVYITERGEIIRGRTITFDVGVSDRLMKEFDLSNFSARNERVKKLEIELGELENSLFQSEMDYNNLSNSIEKFKWELKLTMSKLDVCRKPVEFNNKETLLIQKSINSWNDRINQLNKNISNLEIQIDGVNKRVYNVECEVFKPLSDSLGVDNIATLHRENLVKIHQKSTEIERIKTRLMQIPIEFNEVEFELEKLNNKLKSIQGEIDSLTNSIKINENNLNQSSNDINIQDNSDSDDGDNTETYLNKTVLKLQQCDFDDGKKMEEMKIALAELETSLDTLKSNRVNLIIRIKTEVGESILDSYDVIIEPNTRELERVQKRLDELCGYGDYSLELSQIESALNDLKIDIVKVKGEIEDTKTKFYQLQQKRKTLFMDFLTQVNRIIPEILHILFDLSNNAYSQHNENVLYINNTADHSVDSEPFYCPIFYNFSPNCYNIDVVSHSGGEKSLAGLALILAFQRVKQTPFIVLDEIDAYVDSFYIKGILNYFNDCNGQIITISLRDKLFSQADSLIGVFKNRINAMSRTISLNLSKYKNDEICIQDDSQ